MILKHYSLTCAINVTEVLTAFKIQIAISKDLITACFGSLFNKKNSAKHSAILGTVLGNRNAGTFSTNS